MSEEQDSARDRLAAGLRALRACADGGAAVTFRELAARTHFGAATLNKAATGKEVPTWPVVEGFVRGCGGDPEDYRELWEHAKTETTPRDTAPSESARPAISEQPTASGRAASATPRPRRVPGWAGWVVAAAALLVVAVLAAVLVTSHGATTTASTAPSTAPGPGAIGGGAGPVSAAPVTVAPASTAQISSPAGSTVGFEFTVAGAVSGLPPGVTLWEVTLEVADSKFTPNPRPCVVLGENQFSCGSTFAGTQVMNPGSDYTVLIVAADPDAVTAFRAFHDLKKSPAGASVHGMPGLPPGSRIIGQKTVTRV